MCLKKKAGPIFINSWKSLIKNINQLKSGEILTLESKIINLKNVFIITVDKQITKNIIQLILSVNHGLDIKELILTPDNF